MTHQRMGYWELTFLWSCGVVFIGIADVIGPGFGRCWFFFWGLTCLLVWAKDGIAMRFGTKGA